MNHFSSTGGAGTVLTGAADATAGVAVAAAGPAWRHVFCGCVLAWRFMGLDPPACCMAGRAAPPRSLRTMNITPKTSKPISSRLDIISRNAPDRPMLESSAAMPRPAAMPAMGPNQRETPLLAAAAVPAAAAPAAGAALRAVVLAAGGVTA